MTKISELKTRLMDDPEFRDEYAKADAAFSLIEASVIQRRQAELAKKIVRD